MICAGFLSPVDRADLTALARGPDGSGIWVSHDWRIVFGHRRLSIFDRSEGGVESMATADGNLIVTFNGDIYNYRALRAALEAKGYVFRTESDTEVLLHLYAAKGAAMVDNLRGMFAFAIWDVAKNGLLLARDPYGIKPVCYSDEGGTLRFAAQVKELVAGDGVSRDPEPADWVGFHIFGSVHEFFTTYRAIRALSAGSTEWIDSRGAREPVQHFSVAKIFRNAAISPKHALPSEIIDCPKTDFSAPIVDWLPQDDRLQRWRSVPSLAKPRCPWARRWAYQYAAA
jgi:asparagine synthase (glutamine-hydrolysing)